MPSRIMLRIASVLLGLTPLAALAQKGIQMEAESLFQGSGGWVGFCPVLVTLENSGPNARGTVTVAGGTPCEIPVELPTGARKQVVVYGAWNQPQCRAVFASDHGFYQFPLEFRSMQGARVAAISETVGSLQALATKEPGTAAEYVTPKLAPERGTGYASFKAVFLGDGAERMSDAQIQALVDYAMVGGRVIVPGTPAGPVLRDHRFDPLLAVRLVSDTVVQGRGASTPQGLVLLGEFSMARVTPKPDATVTSTLQGQPLTVSRRLGDGDVYFVALDPMEPPVSRWPGVGRLLQLIAATSRQSEQDLGYGGYSPYGGSFVYRGYPPSSAADGSDPFSAKLPEGSTVTLILIAYLIVVVPVNMLVLKKLNRQELTWVTAPIISLVFAGIFFRFAAGLYEAGFSRSVRGTLYADSESAYSQFRGNIQVFTPRGGSYALDAEGLEYAESGTYEYDYRQPSQALKLVDDGKLSAVLTTNNLGFNDVGVRQRLKLGTLMLKVRRLDKGKVRIEISNGTKLDLMPGTVYWGKQGFPIPPIKPHSSFSGDLSGKPQKQDRGARPYMVCPVQGVPAGLSAGRQTGDMVNLKLAGVSQ